MTSIAPRTDEPWPFAWVYPVSSHPLARFHFNVAQPVKGGRHRVVR